MTDENPLLTMEGLPPFSRIRPEHVVPAVDTLLAEARATIAGLTGPGAEPTWDALVAPLEALQHRVSRLWAPVEHLNAVADEKALRQAHDACLPKLSDFWTEVGQNTDLERGFRAVREGAEYGRLDATRRRVVDEALKDFHLAGVDLPPAPRERFRALSAELATLTNRFAQNVLDATHGWDLHVTDETRLEGLPETALTLARSVAEGRGLEGWVLTLDMPSYLPVLSHARDRSLREEMYAAYTTRASETGPRAGRWDNGPLMEDILRLRHELAGLVGYPSYAHYALAKRMARSPEEVLRFLRELAAHARPVALRELEELTAYARRRDALARLEAWDVPFYAERLREERYAFSQEELRPYFALPDVLQGLFGVAERLFGVTIRRRDGVDTWHPEVTFYEIRDAGGELRGEFYLDPCARPHKRGGDQRGGVGRGGAAQSADGELVLGARGHRALRPPPRDRRPAARRVAREDARGEELPRRPADAAPDRDGPLRLPPARGVRPRAGRPGAGAAGGGACGGGGPAPPRVEPLPPRVYPRFRGRVRRRVL